MSKFGLEHRVTVEIPLQRAGLLPRQWCRNFREWNRLVFENHAFTYFSLRWKPPTCQPWHRTRCPSRKKLTQIRALLLIDGVTVGKQIDRKHTLRTLEVSVLGSCQKLRLKTQNHKWKNTACRTEYTTWTKTPSPLHTGCLVHQVRVHFEVWIEILKLNKTVTIPSH